MNLQKLYIILSSIIFLLISNLYGSYISPGDILYIESWPDYSYSRYVVVDKSGKIYLPYLDSTITVKNYTESELQNKLEKILEKKLKYIKFSVYKVGPGTIKITLVGAIEYPGELLLPSGSRLSTILKSINYKGYRFKDFNLRSYEIGEQDALINLSRNESFTDKTEEVSSKFLTAKPEYYRYSVYIPRFPKKVSLRNIKIIRNDTIIRGDLRKFLVTGDLRYNPVLNDGDVIKFNFKDKVVYIKGAVNFPDVYEITNEEKNVYDFIKLAGGVTLYADTSYIQVVYPLEKETKIYTLSQLKKLKIEPYMHVYVAFNWKFARIKEVEIKGEVIRPGIYGFFDSLTLDSLLEKVGLTKDANLYGIYIKRNHYINIGPFKNFRFLNMIRFSDYKNKNLDLHIKLKDGDTVFVPAKSEVVCVFGWVGKPGCYKWIEGKKGTYYLNLAGGKNRFAYNGLIRVIRSRNGKIEKLYSRTPLYPGDVIYVPEFVSYTNRPSWELVKDVLAVAASAATIIIAYINIKDKLEEK